MIAHNRQARRDMKVRRAESRGDFDEARALFHEYGASRDVDVGRQRHPWRS
jgi:hypothetical protein